MFEKIKKYLFCNLDIISAGVITMNGGYYRPSAF